MPLLCIYLRKEYIIFRRFVCFSGFLFLNLITLLFNLVVVFLGLPFDPQHLVTNAVANIISGLVFGHRFEYDDHQFHLMQKYVDDTLQLPISNWGRVRVHPAITISYMSNLALLTSVNNICFKE